jgi:hypothetical protein
VLTEFICSVSSNVDGTKDKHLVNLLDAPGLLPTACIGLGVGIAFATIA